MFCLRFPETSTSLSYFVKFVFNLGWCEWNFQNNYRDIRGINVQDESHKSHTVKGEIQKAEDGKGRSYKERVEKVENAAFVPLIFTSKGAKSKKTARAISKIAIKLATKRKEDKGGVVKRISTDISFFSQNGARVHQRTLKIESREQ